MKRLRIAFFSFNDPLDKRSWSGTTYYVGQALQRHIGEVDFLGPVRTPWVIDKGLRAIAKATRVLFGTRYYTPHSLLLNWYGARFLRKKMGNKSYDFLCAPASNPTLSFLHTRLPILQVHDSTFRLLTSTYKEYSNLSGFSRWETYRMERRALQKGSLYVYSSDWAKNSAVRDYGVDPSKIMVLPLGANMDSAPEPSVINEKFKNETLTLLFLAVEWERKGGDIAFEALLHLKTLYPGPVRLLVCGCIPPESCQDSDLEVIPFLNKNLPGDRQKFIDILSKSHFLILPTRADCSLLVACESSAYGVPAITTNVGGVSEIVKDGINGFCLPVQARGVEFARCIHDVYVDGPKYRNLVDSSRKRYEQYLNWDVWAQAVKERLAGLLHQA